MQARLLSSHPSWERLICGRGTLWLICSALGFMRLHCRGIDMSPGGSVALFNLEEYESAKEAFETANSIQKKKEIETWIRKCNAELEGLSLTTIAIRPGTTQHRGLAVYIMLFDINRDLTPFYLLSILLCRGGRSLCKRPQHGTKCNRPAFPLFSGSA